MAAPKQYQYLAVQLQKLWVKCERRLQQEALATLVSGGGVADEHHVSHDFEPSEIKEDGSPENISFRHSFAEAPKEVVHDAKGTAQSALEESFEAIADRSSYTRDTSDRVGWEIGAQALADVVASQLRHALRRWETFTRRKRLGDLQSTVMLALQGVPNLAALAGQGPRHHAQPPAAATGTTIVNHAGAARNHPRPSTNNKPAALTRDVLRDEGFPGSRISPGHARGGALTMATLAAETLQEPGTSSQAKSPQHGKGGLAMAALAAGTLQEAVSHSSASFAFEASAGSPTQSSAARPRASLMATAEACLQCGAIHAADALFCKKCGTKRERNSHGSVDNLSFDFLRQAYPRDQGVKAEVGGSSSSSRHASLEHKHREDRPPGSVHMPEVRRPGGPHKEKPTGGAIVPGFAAEVLTGAALEATMDSVFQPLQHGEVRAPSSAKQGDDFVQSLYADQKRVDEIIKLASILWDSGALVAHARPLPLLKASLAFRTSERCLKHCLRDAFHFLWKRCVAKRLEDELLAKGAANADDVQAKPSGDGTPAYLLESGRASASSTASKSGAVHQPDPDSHSARKPATPTHEEDSSPAAAADSSADDRAAKLEQELRKAQAREQEWHSEFKSAEEEKGEKEKEIERLREQLRKAEEAATAAAEAEATARAAVPAKREVVAQDIAAPARTSTAAARASQVAEEKVEDVKPGVAAIAALAGDTLMEAASKGPAEKPSGVTPPDSEAAAEDDKPALGASLMSSEGMNFSELGLGKASDDDDDDDASIDDDELADLLG